MSVQFKAKQPEYLYRGGGNSIVMTEFNLHWNGWEVPPKDWSDKLWIAVGSGYINIWRQSWNPFQYEEELEQVAEPDYSIDLNECEIPFDEWDCYEWPEFPYKAPIEDDLFEYYYPAIKCAYHGWQWYWSSNGEF